MLSLLILALVVMSVRCSLKETPKTNKMEPITRILVNYGYSAFLDEKSPGRAA